MCVCVEIYEISIMKMIYKIKCLKLVPNDRIRSKVPSSSEV